MSDNSPDYERLACLADLEHRPEDSAALRAAAAQARENAKLKESVHNWRRQFNKACEDATAAESANRDLQAEVDRLNRAVEHKDSTLRLCRQFAELKVERAALDRAIAYTGTETPSEETP